MRKLNDIFVKDLVITSHKSISFLVHNYVDDIRTGNRRVDKGVIFQLLHIEKNSSVRSEIVV